ncbi:PH domain-containing protein [Phytomonospora endophytica]|uniref:Putative membrane protein YdbT with pleckstrin-like domain n=1 Tax=Phytomonospora endophytica TaxID=714109 RepID=A0A841FE29_9ACTN|nr:PH domain-containing protein [Phytomonospora endophytica]MBB6033273.1 putative membrane protein YdbT with pleckstrin-like domain [Phytomonospora endophytica]GIG65499.1 hypothetical protein Pen01_17940 [Phytomonospora endophytica]
MGFPNNLLQDDEELILHTHPHWKELFMPIVWFVLIAAFGTVGMLALPDSWGSIAQAVGWAVIAVLMVWLVVAPYVRWATTHYVFTTHRVLLRTGVITRKGRDIPLARINDVSFEQGVIERMFRFGTLVVESAGERGQQVLKDMPQVENAQSTLYRLVEEDHDRRMGAGDDEPPLATQPPPRV